MRAPGVIDIKAAHTKHSITLVEAHVDPKWKDIVMNGYGITKKDAKKLRDWLTQAMRHCGRKPPPQRRSRSCE